MIHIIGEGLFVVGLTVLTNMALEAYHIRRAMEEVGEHDEVQP